MDGITSARRAETPKVDGSGQEENDLLIEERSTIDADKEDNRNGQLFRFESSTMAHEVLVLAGGVGAWANHPIVRST